jgi:hypothetical protein
LGGKKEHFPATNGGKIKFAGIALVARASYVPASAEGAPLNFDEGAGGQMSEICPVTL